MGIGNQSKQKQKEKKMFGKKDTGYSQNLGTQLDELKNEIEELKAKLANSEAELDAVNTSTHLGIWKCFFDEAGNQTGALFTDEFRRMLGYNRQELPDAIDALGGLIHPDETNDVFAAFAAAAADKTGRTLQAARSQKQTLRIR